MHEDSHLGVRVVNACGDRTTRYFCILWSVTGRVDNQAPPLREIPFPGCERLRTRIMLLDQLTTSSRGGQLEA